MGEVGCGGHREPNSRSPREDNVLDNSHLCCVNGDLASLGLGKKKRVS